MVGSMSTYLDLKILEDIFLQDIPYKVRRYVNLYVSPLFFSINASSCSKSQGLHSLNFDLHWSFCCRMPISYLLVKFWDGSAIRPPVPTPSPSAVTLRRPQCARSPWQPRAASTNTGGSWVTRQRRFITSCRRASVCVRAVSRLAMIQWEFTAEQKQIQTLCFFHCTKNCIITGLYFM